MVDASRATGEHPFIAIVDDDDAVREALSDFLQVLDLSCRSFDSAEAFLAAYVPGVFNCVMTDIRMSGMSGLTLQQRLQALDPSVPVIVITSDTDPATRARALTAGVHAFLTKPVEDEILIHHLMSALGRNDSTP